METLEQLNVIIEGSARHAHVTKEHLKILFGEDAQLHNKRELSQPGQYLTEERVRIEGPRGSIDKVSILGPERSQTQVEVSFTDARVLGVTPPVRESGDLKVPPRSGSSGQPVSSIWKRDVLLPKGTYI